MVFYLIQPKVGVIGPEFLDDCSGVSDSNGLDQVKYRAIIDKNVLELKEKLGDDFNTRWFQQDGVLRETLT